MDFPVLPSYTSTVYNSKTKQHEALVEHITSLSWIKILDYNQLSVEDLKKIDFYIEDEEKNKFNSGTLDKLFTAKLKNESEEFICELLNGNKIEAIPPLKFIIKSDTIDLTTLNFKINWRNKK